ncbi:hypothetical protein DE146DRAFT_634981 [Phaeosphaeria sp. MPI-PUGE-AT-0046c]|nr:hypothetical protein DE146DRAFT_634981 [Phaeosphaeria sp. MPI-PUGE-AT-0046c]
MHAEDVREPINITPDIYVVPGSISVFQSQHNDLDLQNLLTDDEGNVTGIIDWYGSISPPRCVGHAALPSFLCHNWFPGHRDDHLVLRTDHYETYMLQQWLKLEILTPSIHQNQPVISCSRSA